MDVNLINPTQRTSSHTHGAPSRIQELLRNVEYQFKIRISRPKWLTWTASRNYPLQVRSRPAKTCHQALNKHPHLVSTSFNLPLQSEAHAVHDIGWAHPDLPVFHLRASSPAMQRASSPFLGINGQGWTVFRRLKFTRHVFLCGIRRVGSHGHGLWPSLRCS